MRTTSELNKASVDYDDEDRREESCFPPGGGRPRLLTEKCSTCIFRPGNLMHLNPGRVKQMTREASQQGNQGIICHQTLSNGPRKEFGGAMCRGFYDAVGVNSNFIRVISRMGGFTEVSLSEGLAQ